MANVNCKKGTYGRVLVVRADGGNKIGAGHLIRCLSLSQAWMDLGGNVQLLTRTHSPSLIAYLESQGIVVNYLSDRDGVPEELKSVWGFCHALAVSNSSKPVVVLDGYHFSSQYQQVLKREFPLLVIDDNGHLPRYHAHALLNQNIFADRIQYDVTPSAVRLFGPKYALLRSGFALRSKKAKVEHCPDYAVDTSDSSFRILVTFGAADDHNVTAFVVNALIKLLRCQEWLQRSKPLRVRAVIGGSNPHYCQLSALVGHSSWITLERDVRDMASLMAWSDLAISAGGSTVWELCCLGVPSIILCTAENQIGIARGLAEVGAAVNLGWYKDLSDDRFIDVLRHLITDQARMSTMSNEARKLVDGLGSYRVCETLLTLI